MSTAPKPCHCSGPCQQSLCDCHCPEAREPDDDDDGHVDGALAVPLKFMVAMALVWLCWRLVGLQA